MKYRCHEVVIARSGLAIDYRVVIDTAYITTEQQESWFLGLVLEIVVFQTLRVNL